MAKAKKREHTITMQLATGAQRDRITTLMHSILGALTDSGATLVEGVETLANVLVRTYGQCSDEFQRQLIEEAMELTLPADAGGAVAGTPAGGEGVMKEPLKTCCNGCDAPPQPPSKVLCKKCLDALDAKIQALCGLKVKR